MKYYNREYPVLYTLVAVRAESYEDYGIVCTLVEYDKKGVIFNRELSSKRVKALKDVLRIGEETAAMVAAIDMATGDIDLSLRSISDEQKGEVMGTLAQHRAVAAVLKRVADEGRCKVEDLYEEVVWSLEAEDDEGESKSAYDVFLSCNDPDVSIEEALKVARPDHLEHFKRAIELAFPKPVVVVSQEVRLVCLDTLNGPEKLTMALNSAFLEDVDVWVIAPPMYKFAATDTNRDRAQRRVDAAVAAAQAAIV
jgi:translation initiation factor 2 subunit 1